MRLVAYLRASTLELRYDDSNKLDLQRDAIARWADANGHEVVATYSDARTSGATAADDRDGLSDALAVLAAGQASGLVVRDLDRLARSVTVQEAVLSLVWAEPGRQVFTTTSGEVLRDDPDDPYRTAMRQMAGVFTELERRMIAKRLRDGRAAKKARGGHSVGAAPYGWESRGGELRPIPSQQAALAYMRELRNGGLSTREIAAALSAEGHPTARGGAWSSASVSRILARQQA